MEEREELAEECFYLIRLYALNVITSWCKIWFTIHTQKCSPLCIRSLSTESLGCARPVLGDVDTMENKAHHHNQKKCLGGRRIQEVKNHDNPVRDALDLQKAQCCGSTEKGRAVGGQIAPNYSRMFF